MDKKELLKKIPFLKDVPVTDLTYLVKIAQEKSYRKNEEIFGPDVSGDSLYIVLTGRIKIFTRSPSGKVKILAYLEKGDFFGEMALLEEESRSAGAIALDDTSVMIIHRKDFQKLLAAHTFLALELLRVLSARLRAADKEIESLTFQNVFGRVAGILLSMAERYGKQDAKGIKLSIELTHQDIAQIVGTAREMVTRVLSRFKRIGCIDYSESDRRVTITDINKVKELMYY
jgi:CRP-like cAMP-binding protein